MPTTVSPVPRTEKEYQNPGQPAVIKLRSMRWNFDTEQPALSMLTALVPQAEFTRAANPTDSFTVKLKVDLKELDGNRTVLEIPDLLSVRLYQHDPSDRRRQNYPAFALPDDSVPVLEADLRLHSDEHPDWTNMTIGIPLAMLEKSEGEHDIVLDFSGVRWAMYVDGELLDNDFPFGYPQWPEWHTWKLDAEYVKEAMLHVPGIVPTEKPMSEPNIAPVSYWTPPGHNCWVGDVVTFFHQGRYHVFYLYDRRHHTSKFGKGAHYFEHISTQDLVTWIEHEAATPLEEQWECIGTGTPFVFDNTFCISYGLHTTRIYPREKTALPVQWEYLEKHGHTGRFQRDQTPGFPAGSTYAISSDGIANFKKSWIMFHPCENPSVYTDPNGRLQMLANYASKGIWESESIDGGWHCIHPEFPPGGDCTFFFRWKQFDYIIGGFTGFWSKPAGAPMSAYTDLVAQGRDFYDGLNVPAITEIADGRFLAAGWLPIRGWGGPLIIRELIQFPDGRIGSKWLKETEPEIEPSSLLAANVTETTIFSVDRISFELLFRVQPNQPGNGRTGISLLPESDGSPSCEFQICLDDCRAQFGPASMDGFATTQKSLREGGMPHRVGDYAIENLIGTEQPFLVRLIVKGDNKLGGSLVDAEIAGQRTMISYRPELTVKRVLFRVKNLELGDLRIAPLRGHRTGNFV